MRRFARALRTQHSTLSRLLNGGRPIQARTIAGLGSSLGLTAAEIRACIAREDAEAVCHAVGRATFRPDCRWIAAVCGLSIDRVNMALHALIHGGRLRMVAADRWIVLDAGRVTSDPGRDWLAGANGASVSSDAACKRCARDPLQGNDATVT